MVLRRPLRSLATSALRLLAAPLAVAAAAAAQVAPQPAEKKIEGPVKGIRLVAQEGGRAAWAPRGDWIAFDRLDESGYSQLWVAAPDFTDERCLSCPLYEFSKRHVGNPTWHPSGDMLVVQVEKPVKRGGDPHRFMDVPGGNRGDDLYAISFDGKQFWNLTNFALANQESVGLGGGDPIRGVVGGNTRVLSPRISYEGSRLAWAERQVSGDGVFGRWLLRVAGFEIKRRSPRLGKIRTYKPGEQRLFVEPGGFTTDDRGLVLSGNLDPGLSESGMDVYLYRLESGELRRLTSSHDELDRFPVLAPNGRKVVWSSSRDIGERGPRLLRNQVSTVRRMDLWMMNADGSFPERLTHFNDVHSPNYGGPTQVRAAAWSPEGDRLLALATPAEGTDPGSLYMIEFHEPIGR